MNPLSTKTHTKYSQLVFHISAQHTIVHTLRPRKVQHADAPVDRHKCTFKYCWDSYVWVQQHSECHAVVSVTLHMPSLFQYPSPALHSLFTILSFPSPSTLLSSLKNWKLNCDPAHCSILEAGIWECIGIHVVFLHLAPYQSCLWFSATGQRRTSSGVSTSCVLPEQQHRGALLFLDTKTKWL